MSETSELTTTGDWKPRAIMIGIVIGALTGAAAAYLLVQRMESEEGLEMTPGEGVKLGVSVFSFLRQVTQLGG